jgi:hypothetical protein
MLAEADVRDYLDEIRKETCSRCVERPRGGPRCAPLGKQCGVQMHRRQLVDALHEAHSELIDPPLDNNRRKACRDCAFLGSDCCPCPMNCLVALVVQAVESVDKCRARQEKGKKLAAGLPGEDRPDPAEVTRVYQRAAGTWTRCDWPTSFGGSGLDLNGWTPARARAAQPRAGGGRGVLWNRLSTARGRTYWPPGQTSPGQSRCADASSRGVLPRPPAHPRGGAS